MLIPSAHASAGVHGFIGDAVDSPVRTNANRYVYCHNRSTVPEGQPGSEIDVELWRPWYAEVQLVRPPTPTSEAVPQRNDVPACRVWYGATMDPSFENTEMSVRSSVCDEPPPSMDSNLRESKENQVHVFCAIPWQYIAAFLRTGGGV